MVTSEAFLTAHPDQHYRLLAQGALKAGRPELARQYFQRAARFGDKLSQAMLAQMLWDGIGGEADRALGYAWMDLAAERATPLLVLERERFWEALAPAERERALAEGKVIHDEYADAVAQPRLEREMRKANGATIGSRIARRSAKTDTCIGTARISRDQLFLCHDPVDTAHFYADRFWEPGQYWAWQTQALEIITSRPEVWVGTPALLDP